MEYYQLKTKLADEECHQYANQFKQCIQERISQFVVG